MDVEGFDGTIKDWFDICILCLIPYKKYNQHFSYYFYVDSWHDLANYELLFAVIYDCIWSIMFCKFLFILFSQR